MSLSTQANNTPKSSPTHNATVKWNDFAQRQILEHNRLYGIRGPRQQPYNSQQQPQQQQQQQQQQQARRYPYQTQSPQSPIIQQKHSPSLSMSPPPQSPPLQKNKVDSGQSWHNVAAQEKASPQWAAHFNNDTYSIPRRTQSHNHLATPRKSVSESVRKDCYGYNNNSNNNNSDYNTQYNYNNNSNNYRGSASSHSVSSSPGVSNATTAIIPAARFQSTLLDPPLCFCNKTAYERQTPREGTIYECHFIGGNHNENEGGIKKEQPQVAVCLFHVHKSFWDVCRRNLREGRQIDRSNPALSSCSAFNVTFRVILQQGNSFSRRSHLHPPNCFCNRPSRLFDDPLRYHQRPFFACRYLDSSDHPVRCGFFLFIENARFKFPNKLIHSGSYQQDQEQPSTWATSYSPTVSYSSISESGGNEENSQRLKPQSSSSSDFPPSPHESVCSSPSATSFNTVTTHNHEEDESIYNPSSLSKKTPEHLVSLLATTNKQRINCYSQPKAEMKGEEMGSEEGEKEAEEDSYEATMTGSNDELIRLLQGVKKPHWHAPSPTPQDEKSAALLALLNHPSTQEMEKGSAAEDETSATTTSTSLDSFKRNEMSAVPGAYGLFIPSSVYSRQAMTKKISTEAHHVEERRKIEELKQKIIKMEEIVVQLEAEKERQREEAQQEQQKLIHLQTEKEKQAASTQALRELAQKMEKEKQEQIDTIQRLKKVLQEEIHLRQQSQVRTVEMEQMAEELIKMNEELTQEVSDKEEKLNYKDLKCRVCFQENIEFALVPCYHCSYCKTCAEKLSECAICREAKFAIQKIYLS